MKGGVCVIKPKALKTARRVMGWAQVRRLKRVVERELPGCIFIQILCPLHPLQLRFAAAIRVMEEQDDVAVLHELVDPMFHDQSA